MTRNQIREVAARIRSARRIAVTSHLRPDGDSICTGLALALMGELLGKEMALINNDPIPFPFIHFADVERIRIGQIHPREFDLIILLECANIPRSGQEKLEAYSKINIDHHYSNDFYAEVNWVDPEASAVGEMVYSLAEALGVRLTPQIAGHLYCAIVSDTGRFQFSNTTAKSLDVGSKLIASGADPIKISEMLFDNNSPEKIKLLGQVLSTLRMNSKGNIALITMFQSFLEAFKLKEIDTEDITTMARSIKDVEIVLFFKEVAKDNFRVSLRSKGRANAAKIAEYFGGGGHVHAAGFTAVGPYEQLITQIPEVIEGLLGLKPDSGKSGAPGRVG